jgi:hypothetical protein
MVSGPTAEMLKSGSVAAAFIGIGVVGAALFAAFSIKKRYAGHGQELPFTQEFIDPTDEQEFIDPADERTPLVV